ncbi:MAG: GNAT family N-acetyltransferase [Pseudolabrys sp.]
MTATATTAAGEVRPLRSADLDRLVAIDSAHVGEPRRRFFEKRLNHIRDHPEDFVHVGVVRDGVLVGFAVARIMRGEFGRDQATATLDAVGVVTESQERGIGRSLMSSLVAAMRERGVQSLQSQADWTQHALLRFFDASGFRLAPRMMLERSDLKPLAESIEDE